MGMFWVAMAIVAVIAFREFVWVPFKQNPYDYHKDEDGNDAVIDNTDKDEK